MKRGGLARTASGGLDSSNLIKAAESAVSDMTNVHEFRADVHLAIRLEFGESQPILFKIRSNRWFMKEVTIRVLWLEVYAPAHLVFDLYYGKLNVSFSSPPTMRWDIELQLGWLSLPDWIEDWLPARIVEALLGRYTAEVCVRTASRIAASTIRVAALRPPPPLVTPHHRCHTVR
jgi:hypothetical protein